MKKTIKNIRIDKIEFDDKYYPRATKDWEKVYEYRMSLECEEESSFPPVVVMPRNGKYLLIDGWHRTQAHKDLGKKVIKAEILGKMSEKEIFAESVRRNVFHGRPLTQYERRNIIIKLTELKMDIPEISKLVHVPIGKIKSFVSGSLVNTLTGHVVVGKSPAIKGSKRLAGDTDSSSISPIVPIGKVGKRNTKNEMQLSLLDEFIEFLTNKKFNLKNKVIQSKIAMIKKLL